MMTPLHVSTPRFSGMHRLEGYTQEKIKKERRQWLIEGTAVNRDVALLKEATGDFNAKEILDLRQERAEQAEQAIEHYRTVQADIAKRTLGGDFISVCHASEPAAPPKTGDTQPENTQDKQKRFEAADRARQDRDGRIEAYANEMAKAFPFTAPSNTTLLANSRVPQITYLLFPNDETLVFTGQDAITVDNGLALTPGELYNIGIPPLMEFREGLRVNFDFRGYHAGFSDYIKNRLKTVIFPGQKLP